MSTSLVQRALLTVLLAALATAPRDLARAATASNCALIEIQVRGIVRGPLMGSCADFLIEAPAGERSALIDVDFAGCWNVGDWLYWLSLVGHGVVLYGVESWREPCGPDLSGTCVFCPWSTVPEADSSWGAFKDRYR